ncbi:hypothetical protein ACIQMR_35380 [Streptomyces sp. NPDC091376]|uniref:hypothetical protein n=1 Tax=Streptomyces sp. NPDC091376 TaxID=3365994 RepID=UPI0038192C9C
MGGRELMGVFDGGTHRVSIRWKSGSEDDVYPDNVERCVADLRVDPDVKAVETRWVHYVQGDVDSALSFGDYWGDEEDDE